MANETTHTTVFLDQLTNRTAVDSLEPESVEQALNERLHEAHEAHPDIEVEDAEFIAHLAQRLPEHDEPLEALRHLRIADLYMACACNLGNATAIKRFNDEYGRFIDLALTRLRGQGVSLDDVRQQLLRDLLVQRGDRPPAIALYAGHGSLAGYVRVAAVHGALKRLKKNKKTPLVDEIDKLSAIVSESDDPELASLKKRYRNDLKQAFQASLAELNSTDRNVLRYHYLSGLTTRQISELFKVDQSTVVRWLARIRSTLLADTRNRLMRQLGIRRTEFESIANLVASQLDLSIHRFFPPNEDGP